MFLKRSLQEDRENLGLVERQFKSESDGDENDLKRIDKTKKTFVKFEI